MTTSPHSDQHGHAEVHEHDLGLGHDLKTLSRRGALRGIVGVAGVGAVGAAGFALTRSTGTPAAIDTVSPAASTVSTADCVAAAPGETAGPYPGDGSNGPNVLVESGVFRSDIRSSFGSLSGTAEGIPMTISLTLQDLAAGCTPGEGLTVYLWHCDREGRYSLYSQGVTDQNYLRGVQTADADGRITFTSVFPACYSGRWPHIHFEVFDSLAAAVSGSDARLTSQIALPQDSCQQVYAADLGYTQSVGNLARVSLDTDNVFSDGWDAELATVAGTPATGMQVSITIGVDSAANNAASGAGAPPAGGPGGTHPGDTGTGTGSGASFGSLGG